MQTTEQTTETTETASERGKTASAEHASAAVADLFSAGAHYGYSRSRRHPSTAPYIFGVKNQVEIIDLEQTRALLAEAARFAQEVAASGKKLLLVGTKPEARELVRRAAESIGQPYVINRFIGGTLTNFGEIKKRIDELTRLREERESGELAKKYTKHERMMVDREIVRLEERFGGLVGLTQRPDAVFIIDPRFESIAAAEARQVGATVIALANSDCDVRSITYPIVANDTLQASIAYFITHITDAYARGQSEQQARAQQAGAEAPPAAAETEEG